jgi:hypothetical protein
MAQGRDTSARCPSQGERPCPDDHAPSTRWNPQLTTRTLVVSATIIVQADEGHPGGWPGHRIGAVAMRADLSHALAGVLG